MNKKAVTIMFIAFTVIQFLIGCRIFEFADESKKAIFVTFEGMAAYAASKDSIQQIQEQLNRIEHKLDKVMGY